MTDDTPDDISPEQLAAEPAPAALAALATAPAADEALARRIEAAAAGELARRAVAHAARTTPRVTRRVTRRPAAASGARDLTFVLARALRPALLAAAAAGLFAVGLARQDGSAGSAGGEPVSDASSAEGAGVRALSLQDPNAQWADLASAPTTDALGRAIGLGEAP